MPQAASPTDRHAAHEQHDDSPVGRRLGGKQDRGYRDGKPPTDAGGTSMAAEPSSHALHQPSKRPSKSVRMRAQRCLEDSSDDCSEGARHRSQPQVGLSSLSSSSFAAASAAVIAHIIRKQGSIRQALKIEFPPCIVLSRL